MKKLILITSVFTIVSCNTKYKTSYSPIELARENVENYIEWINEDLFQGNITQEEYDLMKETYEETLTLLEQK